MITSVQQILEIGIYDRSVSYIPACQIRPGLYYPMVPNSTDEDYWGRIKVCTLQQQNFYLLTWWHAPCSLYWPRPPSYILCKWREIFLYLGNKWPLWAMSCMLCYLTIQWAFCISSHCHSIDTTSQHSFTRPRPFCVFIHKPICYYCHYGDNLYWFIGCLIVQKL